MTLSEILRSVLVAQCPLRDILSERFLLAIVRLVTVSRYRPSTSPKSLSDPDSCLSIRTSWMRVPPAHTRCLRIFHLSATDASPPILLFGFVQPSMNGVVFLLSFLKSAVSSSSARHPSSPRFRPSISSRFSAAILTCCIYACSPIWVRGLWGTKCRGANDGEALTLISSRSLVTWASVLFFWTWLKPTLTPCVVYFDPEVQPRLTYVNPASTLSVSSDEAKAEVKAAAAAKSNAETDEQAALAKEKAAYDARKRDDAIKKAGEALNKTARVKAEEGAAKVRALAFFFNSVFTHGATSRLFALRLPFSTKHTAHARLEAEKSVWKEGQAAQKEAATAFAKAAKSATSEKVEREAESAKQKAIKREAEGEEAAANNLKAGEPEGDKLPQGLVDWISGLILTVEGEEPVAGGVGAVHVYFLCETFSQSRSVRFDRGFDERSLPAVVQLVLTLALSIIDHHIYQPRISLTGCELVYLPPPSIPTARNLPSQRH
ncbi:hypothetical protein MSAN_02023600 [Mycena sanguinolenta]|uniref:Uncharacterized protein n=1 Tax=Mycena sanguinolenta TaxID=230812 RepID=A0A8H6XKF4_9AGAR|nr:hypothetical protein MSAN_02023600 [Mycena sanguinolenta]